MQPFPLVYGAEVRMELVEFVDSNNMNGGVIVISPSRPAREGVCFGLCGFYLSIF